MKKSSIFLLLAAVTGIAFIWRKTTGISQLAKQVGFVPRINGFPTVKNGNLVVPAAVDITNPSFGSIKVEIVNGAAIIGGIQLATLNIPNVASVNIKANSTSTLEGFAISIPINTLLQVLNANIYDVINKNFDAIKEQLSVRLDAVIGGVLNVSVSHSFATDANTQSIGLTSAGRRTLKPFADYSAYIPARTELIKSDRIVIPQGTVEDTVHLMHEVVRTTLADTKRLSQWLKRNTLTDTIQSVFNFIYTHIQYERDSVLCEQVRRPLRTLWDRAGDCDCFATLIGSILTNLDIPFKFRIAAYNGRDYFQHVYVIIPTEDGYLTCDPVLDSCFDEKKPTKVKDF